MLPFLETNLQKGDAQIHPPHSSDNCGRPRRVTARLARLACCGLRSLSASAVFSGRSCVPHVAANSFGAAHHLRARWLQLVGGPGREGSNNRLTTPCRPESCGFVFFASFSFFPMADLAFDDRENTVLNSSSVTRWTRGLGAKFCVVAVWAPCGSHCCRHWVVWGNDNAESGHAPPTQPRKIGKTRKHVCGRSFSESSDFAARLVC